MSALSRFACGRNDDDRLHGSAYDQALFGIAKLEGIRGPGVFPRIVGIRDPRRIGVLEKRRRIGEAKEAI
jgi:hypothetical protein